MSAHYTPILQSPHNPHMFLNALAFLAIYQYIVHHPYQEPINTTEKRNSRTMANLWVRGTSAMLDLLHMMLRQNLKPVGRWRLYCLPTLLR